MFVFDEIMFGEVFHHTVCVDGCFSWGFSPSTGCGCSIKVMGTERAPPRQMGLGSSPTHSIGKNEIELFFHDAFISLRKKIYITTELELNAPMLVHRVT